MSPICHPQGLWQCLDMSFTIWQTQPFGGNKQVIMVLFRQPSATRHVRGRELLSCGLSHTGLCGVWTGHFRMSVINYGRHPVVEDYWVWLFTLYELCSSIRPHCEQQVDRSAKTTENTPKTTAEHVWVPSNHRATNLNIIVSFIQKGCLTVSTCHSSHHSLGCPVRIVVNWNPSLKEKTSY